MLFITVHLVLAQRRIATHFDMDLNSTIPVRQLKAELASQLGVSAGHQQWFYLNSLMGDDVSLDTAGVFANSIIEVRPTPPPNPPALNASASALNPSVSARH